MENQDDAAQLLALIRKDWQGVPKTLRPVGYWVCEYAPLPADVEYVDSKVEPERAWFCDFAGSQLGTIQDYLKRAINRYVLNAPTGHRFSVGVVAFAQYADTDDYYLGMQWAARYGVGWRVSPNADGQMTLVRRLWTS